MWLYSLIIISILIWFQIRWQSVKNYWSAKKVPYYPPHPIMGSLSFLQKKNPAVWMRKIMKEYQSPYVGIWLFWQPGLVINSPEIAKNVLIKDADIFRNRFLSSGKTDPIGGLNLFTVNDPVWTAMRRHLTPVFTNAKLKLFAQILANKSKYLTKRIIADTDKGLTIDLRDVFSDYSTDVIGEIAFGMFSNSTLLEKSPLREITRDFMKFNIVRGLAWSSIFFFPKIVDIFGSCGNLNERLFYIMHTIFNKNMTLTCVQGHSRVGETDRDGDIHKRNTITDPMFFYKAFSFFPKNTVIRLTQIFRAIVQQRGGYEKEIKYTRDLFDVLLKIKQEAAKNGEDMQEELLIAQAAIFLQGGFDTTATALTYTIYELAFQPHLQEKLYRELVETKESSKDDKLDVQKLSELPYLNAVLKETLRKYPIMGWLDRVAIKDYQVDENLTISAGTVIYVNAVGMHSNEKYFPEPEKYDPDRFLPENEDNIKPYTYMPFGKGPRHCIGERFANQSMNFALSTMILNFEVHPVPDSLKPNECSIEKRGLFLIPGEKLSVQFIQRNK